MRLLVLVQLRRELGCCGWSIDHWRRVLLRLVIWVRLLLLLLFLNRLLHILQRLFSVLVRERWRLIVRLNIVLLQYPCDHSRTRRNRLLLLLLSLTRIILLLSNQLWSPGPSRSRKIRIRYRIIFLSGHINYALPIHLWRSYRPAKLWRPRCPRSTGRQWRRRSNTTTTTMRYWIR